MPFLTDARVWAVALVLTAAGLTLFDGRRGRVASLILIAALAVSDLSTARILKPAFGRMRPSHALNDVTLRVPSRGGRNGFPSNHAANAGVVTAVLGTFYPVTLWFVPALAIGVAYSRIYVGVHYPGDVLAGLAYGLGTGAVLAGLARRRCFGGGKGKDP
jgi:undecaprenyl-diphosphatase